MPQKDRKKEYQDAEVRRYMMLCLKKGCGCIPVDDPVITAFAKEFLRVLRPSAVAGHKKIRIGGPGDGGYVSLDPGEGGIAYSFGVSDHSPWDLAMAERNFKVYQYDGSIEEQPDKHPGIFFHKCHIGTENPENPAGLPTKSLRQVIRDNNHEQERDLVLQMDIEGAEWDVFQEASPDDLLRFKQIIVEFHSLHFNEARLEILRKLVGTHTPIHIHYNNCAIPVLVLPDSFLFNGALFEVTLVRSADYTFREDNAYYPTPLDFPCVPGKPEMPIGFFDLLL